MVEDIAGETEESKLERASSVAKLGTLKTTLDVLKRLDRGQTQGTFSLHFCRHQLQLTNMNRHREGRHNVLELDHKHIG